MRGDLKTDSPIRIVLMIALILCFILIVFSGILPGQAKTSNIMYITQLCGDWGKKSCDCGYAYTLSLPVEGGKTKTLAQLCEENYGSPFDCNKCKGACPGSCPSTTST